MSARKKRKLEPQVFSLSLESERDIFSKCQSDGFAIVRQKNRPRKVGFLNDRASGGEGYSQPDAEGSAEPEAESSATFEQTVTSHPTSPYRYLHFSTMFDFLEVLK